MQICKEAYQELIDGDIEWLLRQPRDLEIVLNFYTERRNRYGSIKRYKSANKRVWSNIC